MHACLPRLIALHAVIAGMDQKVHADLAPLLARVMALDAELGKAALRFFPGARETAFELSDLYESAAKMETDLHSIVGNAIKRFAVPPKLKAIALT